MRKHIYICDSCRNETDWLYEMPHLILEGLQISIYNSKKELCKECAKERLEIYNNGVKSDRGGKK